MVATDRVKEIFGDAKATHQEVLERLAAGDIRDAAEKAWRATKRATDALILARTDREPEKTPETSRELLRLSDEDAQGSQAGRALLYPPEPTARRLLLSRIVRAGSQHRKTHQGDSGLH